MYNFVKYIPGQKTFGYYRLLPIFFFTGAAIEYIMIHWHVGEINFYKVYIKKEVRKVAEEQLRVLGEL